jgi:hypothetical protein
MTKRSGIFRWPVNVLIAGDLDVREDSKRHGLFSCADSVKPIGRESSQLYASVSKSQFTVSSYSLIRAMDAGRVPPLIYFVPQLSLKLYF